MMFGTTQVTKTNGIVNEINISLVLCDLAIDIQNNQVRGSIYRLNDRKWVQSKKKKLHSITKLVTEVYKIIKLLWLICY